MKRLMLDIYAGLGGASEAFYRFPNWDVYRVDNNPLLSEVPNMRMLDLASSDGIPVNWALDVATPGEIDLVWASPPCDDFSLGFHAPGPTAKRNGEDFEPDMQHLTRSLEIIRFLKPKWWVIENVAGASRIFSDFLDVEKPTQIIRPYFLWGRFPHIEMPQGWKMPLGS